MDQCVIGTTTTNRDYKEEHRNYIFDTGLVVEKIFIISMYLYLYITWQYALLCYRATGVT